MNRLRKLSATILLGSAAAAALLATPAGATFHEMSIREVYPAGDAGYVELQMWAGGQNFVGGHHLVVYGAGGADRGLQIRRRRRQRGKPVHHRRRRYRLRDCLPRRAGGG